MYNRGWQGDEPRLRAPTNQGHRRGGGSALARATETGRPDGGMRYDFLANTLFYMIRTYIRIAWRSGLEGNIRGRLPLRYEDHVTGVFP